MESAPTTAVIIPFRYPAAALPTELVSKHQPARPLVNWEAWYHDAAISVADVIPSPEATIYELSGGKRPTKA